MAVNDVHSDVPEQGAVFTFGKCKFNGNKPGKFWLKDEGVEDVACGDEHTALISENGKLYTFGENSWGQLGLGRTDAVDKPTKVKKFNENPVVSVACGKSHTLVLTANGSTFGFGCNIDGQTDPYDSACTKIIDPVEIKLSGGEEEIRMLSAGADHSAALTASGVVLVWGSCGYLQVDSQMPAPLQLHEKIKSISCGYYHTALLSDSGKIFCCGEAEGGKLGVGNCSDEYLGPTLIRSIDEVVVNLSAGHSHTCLITESGKLMSFGDGFQGQLGQGTMVMSCERPQAVLLEHKIVQVSCGESHTAVITDDKKLLICGDGRHGKLCFDNLSNYFTFSSPKIFQNVDVLKVACGGCHTIVLVRPKSKFSSEDNQEIDFDKNFDSIETNAVDNEEQHEFNTDSLARSRRRNKKQDSQASLQSHLKASLDIRHSTTEVSPSNCDEKQEKQTVVKIESKNADICDDSEKSNVQHEEDVLDNVHDSKLQNECELNADNGQTEKPINIDNENGKRKIKKRNSRTAKTKSRSQPDADDKPIEEVKDVAKVESEKQSKNSKKRKNSKKHKNNSRKNSSANNTPDIGSDLTTPKETLKVEKKSRFCSIL